MTNSIVEKRELILKVVIETIWPFMPILIEGLIELLLFNQSIGFRLLNKNFLVIGIIIPFIYIPDIFQHYELKFVVLLAFIFDICPLVFYFCYLVNKSDIIILIGIIYLFGVIYYFIDREFKLWKSQITNTSGEM